MLSNTTPAPWTAAGSETTSVTWVEGANGKRICTMRKSEQDWNNAVLMAAAPELLEVLKSLLHVHRWGAPHGVEQDVVRHAKEAITKAEEG